MLIQEKRMAIIADVFLQKIIGGSQMKGKKKFLWFLAAVLMLAIVASSWSAGQKEGEAEAAKYRVRMMAAHWLPTEYSTATVEQPQVITGLKVLADRFKELYPEVEIEFLEAPLPGEAGRAVGKDWLQTRLLQNDIPEIISDAHHYANEWKEEIFLSVEKYAYEPNPFIPGNKQWKDSWRGGDEHIALNKERNKAHTLYQIPLVAVFSGNWHYVNKDVLKDVGLTTENWSQEYADWKVNAAKIKAGGYQVIAGTPKWWVFANAVAGGAAPQFAVLRHSQPERYEVGKGVDWISPNTEEIVRAIKKEIFSSKSPAFQGYWQAMKDYASWFVPGFPAGESSQIMDLWRSGKLALLTGDPGNLLSIINDTERKFDFGFVGRPQAGKRTNPAALPLEWYESGTKNVFGKESTDSYGYMGVSKATAEDPELLKYTILWLQYITAPDQNEFFVNERGLYLPVAKGTSARTEYQQAVGIKVISRFHHIPGYPKPVYFSSPPHGFDNELENRVWGEGPIGYGWEYIRGNISWEELAKNWDRDLMAAADRAMAENEFDTSKW